jgi:hypothetical protein
MKRRRPLQSRKPLRRTGGPRRTGGLQRGAQLQRGGAITRTDSAEEQAAAAQWRVLPTERCAVCGGPGTDANPLQAHHVVSKHTLSKWCDTAVARRGLAGQQVAVLRAAVLWDTRNRMVLHATRHHRHTRGTQPLPAALLTPAMWAFAARYGHVWYLERHYT